MLERRSNERKSGKDVVLCCVCVVAEMGDGFEKVR